MSRRHADADLPGYLWYGYLLSIFALAVVAFIQQKRGDRVGSVFSFVWMITAAVLSMSCLPSL